MADDDQIAAPTEEELRGPQDWSAPGQVDRSRIAAELDAKPWLHDRLNQMIRGEVGDKATPEVRRIQMESAMNRASVRGHTLEQALRDVSAHPQSGYYPAVSFGRGGFDKDTYRGDLDAVLSGSNYGGKYMPEGQLHTGNASGSVAAHQFQKGTAGFTLQTGSGPEAYFNEDAKRQGSDPGDRYNTRLNAGQEAAYQDWILANSRRTGRDLSKDTHDYDMRGYFAENGPVNLKGGHLTDKYKKPNHPTFSDESIYHGIDGHQGGHWTQEGQGWSFEPSKTNLENLSPVQLQGYFDHAEGPNVKLKLREERAGGQQVAGLLDWFKSKDPTPGPVPAEAKGAPPEKAGKLIKPFPSDEEAAFAQQYEYGKGTTRDFFRDQEARVLGYKTSTPVLDKKGRVDPKKAAREGFEPMSFSGSSDPARYGDDPKASATLKLSEHPEIAAQLGRTVSRAALAANRSALASLGFNPSKTAIDLGKHGGAVGTTLNTSDAPKEEDRGVFPMWSDMTFPSGSTMVHESIHRGLFILGRQRPEEYNKIMEDLSKSNGMGEHTVRELVVRQIMRTAMGDVETAETPNDKQIAKAKYLFEDSLRAPQNAKALDKLESMAAEQFAKRGGPR